MTCAHRERTVASTRIWRAWYAGREASGRGVAGGKRGIDDFARAFFGVNDGDYGELPYTREDVIATLNAGDVVFLASQNTASGSMFGYLGAEASPDGRG